MSTYRWLMSPSRESYTRMPVWTQPATAAACADNPVRLLMTADGPDPPANTPFSSLKINASH